MPPCFTLLQLLILTSACLSLLFTLANADLALFWPCFQKALCSILRLGERPLTAPMLPHDLALCPVTWFVCPSPHSLGASRPGAGAHSSCHTQLAGLRQFTGSVSLLESEHVCILGKGWPTLVACSVYSSWIKKLGPFLCRMPCFFFPVFSFQGGTQRGATFTMESTSEFKDQRGKTISNAEFPAFWCLPQSIP